MGTISSANAIGDYAAVGEWDNFVPMSATGAPNELGLPRLLPKTKQPIQDALAGEDNGVVLHVAPLDQNLLTKVEAEAGAGRAWRLDRTRYYTRGQSCDYIVWDPDKKPD